MDDPMKSLASALLSAGGLGESPTEVCTVVAERGAVNIRLRGVVINLAALKPPDWPPFTSLPRELLAEIDRKRPEVEEVRATSAERRRPLGETRSHLS